VQQPKIIDKPALTIVGLETPFIHALSPDTNNYIIGPLWDRFVHRAKEVASRAGNAMYGIIYGRPESERSHPHDSRRHVCRLPPPRPDHANCRHLPRDLPGLAAAIQMGARRYR
jgi:hypothetical protein